MTENKTELLPCPFCGAKHSEPVERSETPVVWNFKLFPNEANGYMTGYAVGCMGCQIQFQGAPTEKEAAETWNTRATVTPSDHIVADDKLIPSDKAAALDRDKLISVINETVDSNQCLSAEHIADAIIEKDVHIQSEVDPLIIRRVLNSVNILDEQVGEEKRLLSCLIAEAIDNDRALQQPDDGDLVELLKQARLCIETSAGELDRMATNTINKIYKELAKHKVKVQG